MYGSSAVGGVHVKKTLKTKPAIPALIAGRRAVDPDSRQRPPPRYSLPLRAVTHQHPPGLLRSTSTAAHSAAEAQSAPRAQSTVQWNKKVVVLFRARAGDVARATTYMSIAQYRAARAADDDRHGKTRP